MDPGGEAFLKELAARGGRGWALSSMCYESQSFGINCGYLSANSMAWAFEKHGMLDAALSYAKQACEPVHTNGGANIPHMFAQGHACAGRVVRQFPLS